MSEGKSNFSPAHVLTALAIIVPLLALAAGTVYTKEEFARRDANAQRLRAELEEENKFLNEQIANAALNIAELQAALDSATSSIEDLEKNKRKAEREIRELEETLETDKQLLQKYSKVFFLNEHYEPASLKKIDAEYLFNEDRPAQFHGEAMRDLERMLDDAADDGLTIKVVSAFRSFDTQSQLKSNYTVQYGSGANAFSADQGYSEHQLGTAVDLTSPAIGGLYTSFGTSAEFKWLQENAHRFGFILSYPQGNKYYVYEPWHWRFVGSDLARELNKKKMYFYDMEQREIDEYLGDLFD